MKKKWLITGGVLGLILLGIALYFVFGLQQTFLPIQGLPEAHDTFIWKDIEGEVTSSYLGTITNVPRREFCSSNEGDVTISNSYSVSADGDKLKLSSSMNSKGQPCSGNGIVVEMELPKGRLYGTYSATAEYKDGVYNSIGSVAINGYSIGALACDPNLAGCKELDSKTNSFDINITEPTKVIIELRTDTSTYGSSSSSVELFFEEDLEVPPIEEEPEVPPIEEEPEVPPIEEESSWFSKYIFFIIISGIIFLLIIILLINKFK